MSIFYDKTDKRKNIFRTIIVVFFVVVLYACAFFCYNIFINKSIRNAPINYSETKDSYHFYYSPANKNKVALTFDDGPAIGVTRSIIETLKKNDVPATFFLLGQNVFLNPNLAKEISDSGFEIGNHSFTHAKNIHSSQNRLNLEVRSTNYLLEKITGKVPKYYRPPFLLGIGVNPTINPYTYTPNDMLWSLDNGLIPTGIDIDPKDWEYPSEKSVAENFEIAFNANPNGHIILLHEEHQTAEALQDIIDIVEKKGYKIVSLDELLVPPTEIRLTKNLYFGLTDAETNGEISKLQWFLWKQGHLDPYLLSGKFDGPTKNSLTSFQLVNGLVDPNNVDPTRVGIVDIATRDLIYSITKNNSSVETISVIEPLKQKITKKVGFFALGTYINYIPAIRMSIIWMVRIALALVVFRVLFLIFVITVASIKSFKSKNIKIDERDIDGVSVLIPAYNEQENVKSTIQSVINNNYSNKEIVVINDGSTDNTEKFIKEAISENPSESIKYISIPNGGKANALNHGVEIAKYDICVVIDADAVLDKNALKYFVPHFKNPEIGAIAGKIKTTGNGGFLNLFQTLEYAIGQNIDKRVFSALGAVGIVPGPAGAWRKSDIIKVGGFSDDTLVEDQDMTLSILRNGKKVIYEPRSISYTETPNTVQNFLKQRFRWVYGTIQCFWKNKTVIIERPFSAMSLIVMPNIFIFNVLLPMTYPFSDLAFIVGISFGEWQTMVYPFLLFTAFDVMYAWIGVLEEKRKTRLLVGVPLQRFSYRQLIYYSVIKSVIRAIEGTGSGWNKFTKTGETQRFYFNTIDNNGVKTPQ